MRIEVISILVVVVGKEVVVKEHRISNGILFLNRCFIMEPFSLSYLVEIFHEYIETLMQI